jgi:hypothetical protein
LLGAGSAFAAEPTPPSAPPTYGLSWVRAEGAEACPNGRALVAEVERRVGRAVFDVAAERSFAVEVTRVGDGFRSDVYVRDGAGHAIGHRQLQSDEPGCGALLNATALAIALVIDPEAAAHEPAPGKSVVTFEAPPPAPPPAPAPPPPAPVVLAAPSPEMLLPARAARTPLTWSLRSQLTGGMVPAASPGFELALGVRPGQRFGYALSGSYTLSQLAKRGIGSLEIGLTRFGALATLDAGRSSSVRLVLGAGPSLGAFHVAVRQPAPVTDPGDYWFVAAQLVADLQISVTKDIFVELGGAGLVPLRRQEFLVRAQADPVWRQALFSGLGFLGVGALFP